MSALHQLHRPFLPPRPAPSKRPLWALFFVRSSGILFRLSCIRLTERVCPPTPVTPAVLYPDSPDNLGAPCGFIGRSFLRTLRGSQIPGSSSALHLCHLVKRVAGLDFAGELLHQFATIAADAAPSAHEHNPAEQIRSVMTL